MHLTNTFYEMAVSKTVLTGGTVFFGPFILQIDTWQMTRMSDKSLLCNAEKTQISEQF